MEVEQDSNACRDAEEERKKVHSGCDAPPVKGVRSVLEHQHIAMEPANRPKDLPESIHSPRSNHTMN